MQSTTLGDSKKRRIPIFLRILLPFLLLIILFFVFGMNNKAATVEKYLPGFDSSILSQAQALTQVLKQTQNENSAFDSDVAAIARNNPNVQIGVAVMPYPGAAIKSFGVTTSFIAASTTKLICGVDYLQQVEAGKFNIHDSLGVYDASYELQLMVNQSDDDAWNLFINLLGQNQIQQFASSIGLQSFNVSNNTIAPSVEVKLLYGIWSEKLLNHQDTQLILSYMQNTNDESLIPAAVPQGAVVYHKYGELAQYNADGTGNVLHDVGIITNNAKTFMIAIYTNRNDQLDEATRTAVIQAITKDAVSIYAP